MQLSTDIAGSAGVTSLSRLYGFTVDAARFAVEHIDTLKAADNALANRCGLLLEAANEGFGVGNETALVLIGVGQHLLGNPLASAATAGAAGANPVIMTCAAIGAIHYGWNAMSQEERDALLKAVGNVFRIGVEFIRSIANFALDMIKSLMSAENIAELKKMVAGVAAAFGTRLSEITRALSDRIVEGSTYAAAAAGTAASTAAAAAGSAAAVAGSAASTAWSYVPSIRRSRDT